MPLRHLLPAALLALATLTGAGADSAAGLPFDPQTLSRLSVDGRPRSLAVRQGDGVWMAYDLEQARLFKCWQAPAGKPGLLRKDFTTQSTGKTLWQAKPAAPWMWTRFTAAAPDATRYLGCSDRGGRIELRWELRQGISAIQLHERIPQAPATGARVLREVRVTGLQPGESLTPPGLGPAAWQLTDSAGTAVKAITTGEWYRLTLP